MFYIIFSITSNQILLLQVSSFLYQGGVISCYTPESIHTNKTVVAGPEVNRSITSQIHSIHKVLLARQNKKIVFEYQIKCIHWVYVLLCITCNEKEWQRPYRRIREYCWLAIINEWCLKIVTHLPVLLSMVISSG